jgi:hypothetical protein
LELSITDDVSAVGLIDSLARCTSLDPEKVVIEGDLTRWVGLQGAQPAAH